jgi:hypothetical protein
MATCPVCLTNGVLEDLFAKVSSTNAIITIILVAGIVILLIFALRFFISRKKDRTQQVSFDLNDFRTNAGAKVGSKPTARNVEEGNQLR